MLMLIAYTSTEVCICQEFFNTSHILTHLIVTKAQYYKYQYYYFDFIDGENEAERDYDMKLASL